MAETGARAAHLLLKRLDGEPRPHIAARRVPFLIPLQTQCTKARIFIFNPSPDCILRLQIGKAPHDMTLEECIIPKGEAVLGIHRGSVE